MTVGDRTLYSALAIAVGAALAGWVLALVYLLLRRSRPGLAIGLPLAAGLGLRILAAGGVSLADQDGTLRGRDEVNFLHDAQELARASLLSQDSLQALTSTLHVWIFSIETRLDLPEFAMRMGQIGLASVGLMLLSIAVYDLRDARAARLSAWVLAFEPASVFFSNFLHKEPFMLFALGLVAFGATKIWTRGDYRGLLSILAGCAVGVAARPYAGWFLVGSAGAVILHASIRHHAGRDSRALVPALAVLLVMTISLPRLVAVSSTESLARLQSSQDANASDDSNLRLDRVDFSTPRGVALNLPRRIRDVVLRPYPWETANLSQRLGVLGTLVALTAVWLLLLSVVRHRALLVTRAAPLLYPALFLLIAYSLSAGNAGTSFRYRAQVVVLALCAIVAVRSRPVREHGEAHVEQPLAAHTPVGRLAGARGSSYS